MTLSSSNLAERLANATRSLAKVRHRLAALGQTGELLKADIYLYEATRQSLIVGCRQAKKAGRIQGRLYLPRPISQAVVQRAGDGRPSLTVIAKVADYAGRLREAYDAVPACVDPFERSLRGLENEIRIVVYYATERACDVGMPVVAGRPDVVSDTVNKLRALFATPQARSALDMSIGLLMGAATLAAGRQPSIPAMVQQGLALAELVGQQRLPGHAPHTRPEVAQASPVEAEVVASQRVEAPVESVRSVECDPATRECKSEDGKVIDFAEAKKAQG